jgi:hypothetical protein
MSGPQGKQPNRDSFELMDGDIRVWIEQEAVHIKAIEQISGDPVELTSAMARRLADALNRLADQADY